MKQFMNQQHRIWNQNNDLFEVDAVHYEDTFENKWQR